MKKIDFFWWFASNYHKLAKGEYDNGSLTIIKTDKTEAARIRFSDGVIEINDNLPEVDQSAIFFMLVWCSVCERYRTDIFKADAKAIEVASKHPMFDKKKGLFDSIKLLSATETGKNIERIKRLIE